jgi:hypothetical protein
MAASYAGPCTEEIGRIQRRVDEKIEAAAGPAARERHAATVHREPTPASIAAVIGAAIEHAAAVIEESHAAMMHREPTPAGSMRAPTSTRRSLP